MGAGRYIPSLLEFFSLRGLREAPVDDEGRPLRTPDPFAPPTKMDPVGSSTQGAGLFQKPQARTEPKPPKPGQTRPGRTLAAQAKPSYRGSYVGQTWTTNGQMDYKNTQWKDRETGERRFGRVPSMNKVTMVWDGNDWIPQQEFDHKARSGQLKKK